MAENGIATRTNSTRRAPLFAELGATGLRHFDGRLDEEFLQSWRRPHRERTIAEMVNNDPVISAMLFAIEMLIRQVTWEIQPANEDNASQEGAEFARQCLFEDMSTTWADTLSEILTFIPYGFQFSEIVYKRRMGPQDGRRRGEDGDALPSSKFTDGKVGLRKLAPRAQETLERWRFDRTGGVQAMVQQQEYFMGQQVEPIPIEKALLFRTSSRKGSPEGNSILRPAFIPYHYKKKAQEYQMIGIARDLAGMPFAQVPVELMTSTDPADIAVYNQVKRLITSIHRDEQEGIIFPLVYDERGNELYKLSLLSTGGSRQFDIPRIIEYYDQRMVASVLASVILMGQDRVGSFALADNNTELFAVALGAWCQSICEVINRHLWPRLWRYNGMPLETVPKLTAGDIESVNLTELSNFILRLSQAGMPVDDLTNAVRSMAKLPEMDEDELAALREAERREPEPAQEETENAEVEDTTE